MASVSSAAVAGKSMERSVSGSHGSGLPRASRPMTVTDAVLVGRVSPKAE